MNYYGVGLVEKPKLVKILQSVQSSDLPNLYGALRATDESLRKAFILFLSNNPIEGSAQTLDILSQTPDAMTAVRAAAVCLLATQTERQNLDAQS